jgi:serine phosphatase RsbU (regulator of sigma subunit)
MVRTRGLVVIVGVILALGIGGTVAISDATRTSARLSWEQEAANTARSLSGTLLGWLEESYAPLSGLAAITENSDDLTETEFLNAFDGLEARATTLFLEGAALIEPVTEGGKKSWRVKFSTHPDGVLEIGKPLENLPDMLDAVRVAEDRFGEMILGHPLGGEDALSKVSPTALATFNPSGTLIILGIVDYNALIEGLFQLHVPKGVSLQITGRFPEPGGPGPERTVLKQKAKAVLHTVPIRTVSAGAELLISWDFDADFSGGPNTGLANAMLAFGVGMTLFVVIFIAFLLSQNRIIRKRVEEATADLNQALETISSSIDYASHIQRSILPSPAAFKAFFSDHFVIWEPRNVVGGDIYWLRPWGEGTLMLLGDCTGHGVPGAFMTMIATGALDRAQSEIPAGNVGALVQRMHQLIQATQKQDEDSSQSQEGMELGVCYFNSEKTGLDFCGARFSLFIAQGTDVQEVKGERKGIGYARVPAEQIYKSTHVPIDSNKAYYLTTDGYVDQVGGEKRRSYGKQRFIEAIAAASNLELKKQAEYLQESLRDYQGDRARLDDVALIGFRI